MHKLAIAAGKKNDFFKGEPAAPKPIMNYAGVESE
jgi:hypothetical protein